LSILRAPPGKGGAGGPGTDYNSYKLKLGEENQKGGGSTVCGAGSQGQSQREEVLESLPWSLEPATQLHRSNAADRKGGAAWGCFPSGPCVGPTSLSERR